MQLNLNHHTKHLPHIITFSKYHFKSIWKAKRRKKSSILWFIAPEARSAELHLEFLPGCRDLPSSAASQGGSEQADSLGCSGMELFTLCFGIWCAKWQFYCCVKCSPPLMAFFFWDLFESQSVIPANTHTETDWWLIICRFTLQMSAIARTKTGQSQELEIHLGFLAGCRNWDTQTFICHLLDQLRAVQPRLRPDAPVWDVGIAIPTPVDLSKSTF